jgi:hypothetical protein
MDTADEIIHQTQLPEPQKDDGTAAKGNGWRQLFEVGLKNDRVELSSQALFVRNPF